MNRPTGQHEETGLHFRPWLNDLYVIKEQKDYDPLGIEDGDVVLDIGAHIGAFAAKAVRDGAVAVSCYEPEPGNFGTLEANQGAIVGETGAVVRVEWAAVVPQVTGPVVLYQSGTKQSSTHSTVEIRGRDQKVEVPAVSFWDALHATDFSVLKIDIEGAEYGLDLSEIPDSVKKLAIEFHLGRKAWVGEAKMRCHALSLMGFEAVTSPNWEAQRASLGIWRRA